MRIMFVSLGFIAALPAVSCAAAQSSVLSLSSHASLIAMCILGMNIIALFLWFVLRIKKFQRPPPDEKTDADRLSGPREEKRREG